MFNKQKALSKVMPFIIEGLNMAKEDGYKNLIPLNKRTKEEQRRIQKKGGKESVRKRKENKTFKELLKEALEVVNTNSAGEEKTCKEIIVVNLVRDAMRGDKKATQMVAEMVGEYVNKSEITACVTNAKIDVTRLTDEQLKALSEIETNED